MAEPKYDWLNTDHQMMHLQKYDRHTADDSYFVNGDRTDLIYGREVVDKVGRKLMNGALGKNRVVKLSFDSFADLEYFFVKSVLKTWPDPGYKTKVIGKSLLIWKLKVKKNE